ncbi:hypothetical protein MPTK1_6g20860 [Marchantia polymorpha subsp. ruderalis]|uniref:Cyanobacterial aminoacyl-tRNA synthetase CAAD domain-containing protein n=2 Tax=Marchantia polymorpha TaxID=3197 RepID=A0A176VTX5_MARPO|nr:hypothetical protein AXG93_2752s2140 [Marchantia polymorpha subsp. ruderalis]PTQ33225.1 hypothetical protein MARPO_0091s0069 [Marchantia polymorpha]BBN15593.1 hypothetical protein Mp_6g20860 [Marchantia polymorpha subsp. ruderalis]|eukprot:PTQ33225.1 hypothetical protein MARPO_0091s0069 [Marchantia polymorpha]
MASTAVAVGGQLSLSLGLARKSARGIAGRSAVSAAPCLVSARLGGSPQQVSSIGVAQESKRRFSSIIAKASEQADASEQATEVLKGVQEWWEKVDDKLAIGGLGFAGLILLWASTGLISALDKLPLVPDFFEVVGILFSGWFTYRYLLFKPDREELAKIVDEAKGKITGTGSGELEPRAATTATKAESVRSPSVATAGGKQTVDSDSETTAEAGKQKLATAVGVAQLPAEDGNGVGTSASGDAAQGSTDGRRLGRDDDVKASPDWQPEGAPVGEWVGFANPGPQIGINEPNGTVRPDVSV